MFKIWQDVANVKFQVCQLITVILAWFIKLYVKTQLQSLDGKEPVLVWPHLSQFVTHLTDFSNLEVIDNALLGYMFKTEKF